MKKCGLIICVFWLLAGIFGWPGSCLAADAEPAAPVFSWQEAAGKLELQKMEEFKGRIDGELSNTMQDKPVSEWVRDFVTGKWQFDPAEIGKNLLTYLIGEVLANGKLLGKLLVLAVISALLVNLQSSFENQGVSKLSGMACFLALSAIALGSFKAVLAIGMSTVSDMTDFMTSLLPQMMILVTGLGHVNTAATTFPMLIAACDFVSTLMGKVIFPLIIFSAVLGLLDCLGDTVKVQRLGKLVTLAIEVLLGLMATVFMVIFTMKSLYGSVLDALTLKTGKFLTDAMFPVVGGFFADAMETAAGYVVLLKHAVGIVGILIIFGILIFPVLKIAVIVFVYKFAAALIEPLGDSRTSQALDIMGNHLILVMAAVAVVGFMFLISLAIIGSIGNSMILTR